MRERESAIASHRVIPQNLIEAATGVMLRSHSPRTLFLECGPIYGKAVDKSNL